LAARTGFLLIPALGTASVTPTFAYSVEIIEANGVAANESL
jgi:hypothetical protein